MQPPHPNPLPAGERENTYFHVSWCPAGAWGFNKKKDFPLTSILSLERRGEEK